MATFTFTTKTKSAVLQIDGGNQIPINGLYAPIVLMPVNKVLQSRPVNIFKGLPVIPDINVDNDTITIDAVPFAGATAQDLYDSLETLFFLTSAVSSGGGCLLETFNLGLIDGSGVDVDGATSVVNSRATATFTANNISCFVDFDNTATVRLGVYDSDGVLLGESSDIVMGAVGIGLVEVALQVSVDIVCGDSYRLAVKFIDNGTGNGFNLGKYTTVANKEIAEINNFSAGSALPDPIGATSATVIGYYVGLRA